MCKYWCFVKFVTIINARTSSKFNSEQIFVDSEYTPLKASAAVRSVSAKFAILHCFALFEEFEEPDVGRPRLFAFNAYRHMGTTTVQ